MTKKTTRDNWRVVAVVRPMRTHMTIASLGFKDEWGQPLEGHVTGPNFEITVEPHGPGWRSIGDWTFSSASGGEEGCKEIQRGLLKHPNVIEARIECDEEHYCAHCGCGWEELDADSLDEWRQDDHSIIGEPMCCDKAINEHRTERGAPLVVRMT